MLNVLNGYTNRLGGIRLSKYVRQFVLFLGVSLCVMGFSSITEAGGSGSKMGIQATKGLSPYVVRGFSISATKRIAVSNKLNKDARVVLGFRDSAGKSITGQPLQIFSSQTCTIEVPDKAERLHYIYIDAGKESMYDVDGSLSAIDSLSLTDGGFVTSSSMDILKSVK